MLANRLLGGAPGGDDLVQEAFVRVFAARGRPRTDPELLAYVAKTIVNLSRGHFRRERMKSRVLERQGGEGAAASTVAPDAMVERDEALRIAIDRLSRRQREVVLLRYWLGLSVLETASAMRLSQGSVKTHSARALEALRSALQQRKDAR